MSKWVRANLSDIAEITMGQSPDSASYNEVGNGYPFLQGCADFGKRYPKARIFCSDAKKIGRKNSILISVRAPVGELNLAGKDYCVGRGLSAIYPRKANRDFLFNTLLLNKRFFNRVSQGSTFEAINSNDLNSFNIDYPDDIAFQNKIARILNAIDAVIERTELAIEKLKSIKQGVMHDLFTRGIDVKTGELRPPYSEASKLYKQTELGWISKEWDVKSFDETCLKVADRDHYTPRYVEHGVLMVSPKDFKDFDLIDFSNCRRVPHEEHKRNMKKTDLKTGDLVFTRIGALLGKVAIIEFWMPVFSILHSACMIRTNTDKILSKYMLYFMKSDFFQDQILSDIQSIGVPDLGLDKIKCFLVSYPMDIDEQRLISERLISFFDHLFKESVYLKKVLKLKQGLMQDLLTGKVEVTPDPQDKEYQGAS